MEPLVRSQCLIGRLIAPRAVLPQETGLPYTGAMVRLSVLDLSPIAQGATAAHSFRNSLSLARHAERLGYERYWLAEHHGMPGIASAATAVLLSHIGRGTSTLSIGAGGFMLPNHSPLVIAEQFVTLE
jgi:luciferase family oxidoreductase group 1